MSFAARSISILWSFVSMNSTVYIFYNQLLTERHLYRLCSFEFFRLFCNIVWFIFFIFDKTIILVLLNKLINIFTLFYKQKLKRFLLSKCKKPLQITTKENRCFLRSWRLWRRGRKKLRWNDSCRKRNI